MAVTRSDPVSRKSMILVAYTAFSLPPTNFKRPSHSIRAVEVEGEITEILFEGRLIPKDTKYEQDTEFLTGVDCELQWREKFNVDKSNFVDVKKGNRLTRIEFVDLQPGDVVAFKYAGISIE